MSCFFKIIVSNYNNSLYISKCINSILCQKFKDFKIVIVDDLSTDRSYDMCIDLQNKHSDKIIIRQVDVKGYAGKCRNIGLDIDLGSKYTWIIDSDDYLHNDNTLYNMYYAIISNNYPDVLRCSYNKIINDKVLKKVTLTLTDINAILKDGAAPWKNCFNSKFDHIKFIENRAKNNDIVHFLRLFDQVDITKISTVKYPCIMYRCDSVNSCQHGKNKNSDICRRSANELLISDLVKEKFVHSYCQNRKIHIITNRLNKGIKFPNPYDNIPDKVFNNAINYTLNKQHLSIFNPTTYTDKIGWLKVFDATPKKTICADKIRVHEYIKEKLGKDICVPILKIFDSADSISLAQLPNQFVLKTNHGYKQNIIVKNKNDINLRSIKTTFKKWLTQNFALRGYELQYYNIAPKCFAEKYLADNITDYKFLCFNGVPRYCQIIKNRNNSNQCYNIYDMNFQYIDNNPDKHNINYIDEKPKHFDLMKSYATKLSEDFKLVRVDFYDIDDNIYVGELTFTPASGNQKFKSVNDNIIFAKDLII